MYSSRTRIEGVQWDDGNREKCQKHGVSLAEIEAVLASESLMIFPDPNAHEERLRGVGRSADSRYVFIVWTLREQAEGLFIRPISVRYMHQKEIEHYERS